MNTSLWRSVELYILSSPYVRPDSPERCTNKKAYVLPELEERPLETEFIHDRIKDEPGDDLYTHDES